VLHHRAVIAAVLTVGILACAPKAEAGNPAQNYPLLLGFEMGFASAGDTDTQWLYAPALNVGWTTRRNLAVGIQTLTFGWPPTAAGERFFIGGTPYVENYRFLGGGKSQVFGQLALPFQSRSGAGLSQAFGVGLQLGLGGRYWITPQFSLGLHVRATRVMSSGFAMNPRIVPTGAIIISSGFMLEGHI